MVLLTLKLEYDRSEPVTVLAPAIDVWEGSPTAQILSIMEKDYWIEKDYWRGDLASEDLPQSPSLETFPS